MSEFDTQRIARRCDTETWTRLRTETYTRSALKRYTRVYLRLAISRLMQGHPAQLRQSTFPVALTGTDDSSPVSRVLTGSRVSHHTSRHRLSTLVAASASMHGVYALLAQRLAPTEVTLTIAGETGTGKDALAEREAEQVTNQRRKEAIIREAERVDVSDPKAAQATMRELQARYDDIGRVPRQVMRTTDDRMRAAEQRVRDAVEAQWRRGTAKSNPFLAELRARLVEAEAKLERARAAGDAARIARAEADVAARRALIPN